MSALQQKGRVLSEEGLLQVDYDRRLVEYGVRGAGRGTTGIRDQYSQEPRVGVPSGRDPFGDAALHASGKESDLHCGDPWQEAGDDHWSDEGAGHGSEESKIEQAVDEAEGEDFRWMILEMLLMLRGVGRVNYCGMLHLLARRFR